MRSITSGILITLFSLAAFSANAQDDLSKNNTGSFYSLFGVGYPFDNMSARETGLGLFGVSLDNVESNSLANPALWGLNNFTTASTGFRLSQFNVKGMGMESTNALLEANSLQIVLPLYRQKLGLSASLYPVTKSNYRIFTNDFQVAAPGDTINYITDLKGTGGVNKLEVGLGWKINSHLSLGYAPSLAFISRNNSEKVFFQQIGYTNTFVDNRITGVALAHRFGILLSASKLLSENDRFSAGAALTLPVNIDAKRKRTVTKMTNEVQEYELSSNKGSVNLPMEVVSGITYYPSPFVNVSVEGQVQTWSDFESELQPGYETADISMTNRFRLGLGTEYHPYKFNSGKFLSKFRYTAGFSYDSGHLAVKDHNIDTYWVSAGLGIFSRASSTIDVSFRYGIRGTTSNDLIQENIWTINLSVNLAEFMFHRPKLN